MPDFLVTVNLTEPQIPVTVNEGVITSIPLSINCDVPAPIGVSVLPPGAAIEVTITGQGASGPPGPAGPAGAGVPPGGTTAQLLAKINATDYNTEWVTPPDLTTQSIDAGYF
jgi:hypothetical protein